MSQLLLLFLVLHSILCSNKGLAKGTQQILTTACSLDFTADLILENDSTIVQISTGAEEKEIRIHPHVLVSLV